MVEPCARREVARQLTCESVASERRSCRLLSLARSTSRYTPQHRADEKLKDRLGELATLYPAYGYLLLHGLLKAEGLVVNHKRTYRLYVEAGLQLIAIDGQAG